MADRSARAREIIDASQYLTLATADAEGRPWATPVWFAHDDYAHFVWVSSPDARHSRNLVSRPEVGMVVFDSTVPIGTGEAVYADAAAAELGGPEAATAVETYSRRSLQHGGREWTIEDVSGSGAPRLYRATASALFILGDNDERIAVELG